MSDSSTSFESAFDMFECEAAAGAPTIVIVSDSLGDTAAEVALAAAAQFGTDSVRIQRLPKVTSADQVRRFISDCVASSTKRFLVFHTIADRGLRCEIQALLDSLGVPSLDLLGPALDALEKLTGVAPSGQAGVLRRTDERYFRRIEAMEFFVEHDDGRNPEDLTKADIVLIGVSRTSKTPLSMFLSVHGFKVANVPLAHGLVPPSQLFDVEPFRVFGLVSTPEVLSTIRNERLGSLQAKAVAGSYADPLSIQDELDEARALMRRIGCIVIHTDGRAVEETAQIIQGYFTRAEAMHEARMRRVQAISGSQTSESAEPGAPARKAE